MTKRPLCRYCGKPIAKRATTVYFEKAITQYMRDTGFSRHVLGQPTTKAEAQRLVNQEIVSVERHHSEDAIYKVSVWDGESYVDEFFCNGTHAKDYAYMVAHNHPEIVTVDYYEALKRQKEKINASTHPSPDQGHQAA